MLLELKEGEQRRFRCHTGHAYSPESLMAELNESVEDALWSAVRSMQESAMLMHQLAEHAATEHGGAAAQHLRVSAENAQKRAELVRHVVLEQSSDIPAW